MIALSFDREWSYGSGTHAVTVPIRIESLPYLVPAILDTGAAVSFLDLALLPDLGISDVTSGPEIPVTAANGAQGTAYLHALQIEILGRRLSIQAAFCPDWPRGRKNLLGMRGFFEQILIAFDHGNKKIYHTIPARHMTWAFPAVGPSPLP